MKSQQKWTHLHSTKAAAPPHPPLCCYYHIQMKPMIAPNGETTLIPVQQPSQADIKASYKTFVISKRVPVTFSQLELLPAKSETSSTVTSDCKSKWSLLIWELSCLVDTCSDTPRRSWSSSLQSLTSQGFIRVAGRVVHVPGATAYDVRRDCGFKRFVMVLSWKIQPTEKLK